MSFFKKIFGLGKKKEVEIEEEKLVNIDENKEKLDLEEKVEAINLAEEAKKNEEIKKQEELRKVEFEMAETKRLAEEAEEKRLLEEEKLKKETEEAEIKAEEERLENERKSKEELKREEDRIRIQAELREAPKKKGIFSTLKEKLVKTREGLFGKMKSFFAGKSVIDEEMYEELEEILIQSDIGMSMTLKIVENLEKKVKAKGIKDPSLVYDILKEVMEEFLIKDDTELNINKPGMNVLLVVGVNGVGKTTTIGKIASKLVKEGKKVVVGAGDTFRAAAVEQLEEWCDRAGADIVKHGQGTDPGAVVFDTIESAKAKGADVVIIDTAGRLHNKNNLMKELQKINDIIERQVGSTDYESILVIDGTTGQNGLNQAKVFNEVTKLTGFIVTKLDGTAKGGIVFSISEELKKPIKYIGVGEGIEDLRRFDAKEYIKAIFE